MNKNNTSGYTGVYFDNTTQKWRAQISYGGEKIKLGYFSSIQDAVDARKNAEDFYAFPNVSGFKIPYFVFRCKNIPSYINYQTCVYFLFNAARYYVENKISISFSAFAIDYIVSRTNRLNDNICFDDISISPLLKDWLDGMSINKISKKYNMQKSNVNLLIKNEIKNKFKIL